MNFTLFDAIAATAAIVFFPLFLVVPGYVLGWLLNLISFRKQTPLLRMLLSLPLSIALTPIILYLLGREFSILAVWAFYGAIWACFLWMLKPGRNRAGSAHPLGGRFPPGIVKPVAIIASVWIAVALVSLVDLQFGNKLYFTVVSYDYTVRSGVISAISRADWFPPANPFFFPGHPTPFRYHYFWFLLCAMPNRLAHGLLGPRHVLMASVVWIGLALMATVAVYQRLFHEEGPERIRKRTFAALVLLAVTGLDIFPTLLYALGRLRFSRGMILPTVDWWNHDQVTGWLDTTLWVPHHLSGLLACMIGFLILWDARPTADARIRWQAVLGAGLAFGSASGLSIYVTFAFAAGLGLWCVVLLVRRHFIQFWELAAAGTLAAAVGSPFLLDLARMGSSGPVQGASFVQLGVRMFPFTHMALNMAHLYRQPWIALGDLVSLPLNFLLELGVLFVVARIYFHQWLRSKRPPADAAIAALAILVGSALVSTFLRSNTIDNNDLGMRGMLIVQFILVMWGGPILADWRTPERAGKLPGYAAGALAITLLIGAATNVYELFMLRSFTMLTDAGIDPGFDNMISPGANFGARVYAFRKAWEWLDTHTPRSVIEQHNPIPGDLFPGLYSNRQMVMLDPSSSVAFGGDPAETKPIEEALTGLFGPRSEGVDVDALCRELKIDYLMARSGDAAWDDAKSWVWTRQPVYANRLARAFSCGK